MGISEPMDSGCFLLSTSILAVQTVKHASPPSASDHFHQGKGVWSKQEDVAGWLPSALKPPHSASLLLLSNLTLFWPGPLGIWLTTGYQDPHCVVMSLWLFLFTITLYVPLIPFLECQRFPYISILKKFLGMLVKMQILGPWDYESVLRGQGPGIYTSTPHFDAAGLGGGQFEKQTCLRLRSLLGEQIWKMWHSDVSECDTPLLCCYWRAGMKGNMMSWLIAWRLGSNLCSSGLSHLNY